MTGFGQAEIKAEGKPIAFDKKGGKGKAGVGNDWMEIPIPKNMSRKRVHAMVDKWLDQRAKGFPWTCNP